MSGTAPSLRRSTVLRMSGLTLVSRLTGFARVVVVAAVLGTSYLGNTYQTANAIPNILFELFAAGALQSVLVPIMVEAVDRQGLSEAERTAGAVLGAMLTLLGAVVAAGLVAGPLVMRLLVAGVDDPAVRADQVRLGTFLLWFFLPQILFYAANMVATAVLNARGSFVLPVFAPTVNNVVVIGTYLVFAAMRGGRPPSLDLSLDEKLVLALGTTAGVVAFCAVPVIGLWRSGFRLRPVLDVHHPVLRRLARQGLWAAGFLAVAQLLLVVVLWFSNTVVGGVVVYQLAFVLFMLPNSLFAVPVFTTVFPDLTRAAVGGAWSDFGEGVARATRSITFLTIASAAGLLALAPALAPFVARGNAAGQVEEVAAAIAAFGVGLPAYSVVLFCTRVSYAHGDTRTPTVVNTAVLVVGSLAIWGFAGAMDERWRVAAIGLGFSAAQVVGAVSLWAAMRAWIRDVGATVPGVRVPFVRTSVVCCLAAAAGAAVVAAVGTDDTLASVTALLLGAATLVVMILGLQWLLGGPDPRATVRSLGSDPGRGRA